MRALPVPPRALLLAAPLLVALLLALTAGGVGPAAASSPAPELQAPDGSGGAGTPDGPDAGGADGSGVEDGSGGSGGSGEQPGQPAATDVAPLPPAPTTEPTGDADPTDPRDPTAPTTRPTDGTDVAPTAPEATAEEPAPSDPGPTGAPATVAPDPTEDAGPTSPATTAEPTRLSPSSPAIARSSIPLGSVALAVLVLVVGGLLVRAAVGRGAHEAVEPDEAGDRDEPHDKDETGESDEAAGTGSLAATAALRPVGGTVAPAAGGSVAPDAPLDPATLDFLLTLGRALVEADATINEVQDTLVDVAAVNGVQGVEVVVMPTALFISLPHRDGVQTQVSAAGTAALRLDQVDEVFRIVDRARRGTLSPSDGRVALAQVRAAPPRFSPGQQLLGYVLFTLGLVLILQGGWLELLVGSGLGLLVGALHLASERFPSSYRPFLPVVAALGASSVVLAVARVLPELAVFPPLVAALVAFLPGALLTTAVLELSTGQIMSGSGRLAAGALRLVLLALGILAGAQLVGVPGASIDNPVGGAAAVVATWAGVAVFGLGVVMFKGARWSSLPWIVLVLYVAYAGQVLGGLLFGSTLSAFFGALAMTPVALVAARQESGPPAQVSFLPGFWLLVPGAVGLEGVTRFLDEDTAEGISSLVTMGTSMVAIALGVLLGLAVGGQVTARLRARQDGPERVTG